MAFNIRLSLYVQTYAHTQGQHLRCVPRVFRYYLYSFQLSELGSGSDSLAVGTSGSETTDMAAHQGHDGITSGDNAAGLQRD